MKAIPETFDGKGEVSGYVFERVDSNEKALIYKRTDTISGAVSYEVFKRKTYNGGTAIIGGVEVTYSPKERYPKSKDFGVWAWCFGNEELALNKFRAISK
jgi:hypothetical protein